jgi:hypothetical protein
MDPSLLVPLFATLLCYVLFRLGRMVYDEVTSPIRHLPGPKNHSWIVGNFFDMGVIAPNITCRIHELTCPPGRGPGVHQMERGVWSPLSVQGFAQCTSAHSICDINILVNGNPRDASCTRRILRQLITSSQTPTYMEKDPSLFGASKIFSVMVRSPSESSLLSHRISNSGHRNS